MALGKSRRISAAVVSLCVVAALVACGSRNAAREPSSLHASEAGSAYLVECSPPGEPEVEMTSAASYVVSIRAATRRDAQEVAGVVADDLAMWRSRDRVALTITLSCDTPVTLFVHADRAMPEDVRRAVSDTEGVLDLRAV